MTLQIPSPLLRAIEEHAARTYPEECCGLLLGVEDAGVRNLRQCVAASNEREGSSRHNRYLISPESILAVQKDARTRGMEILGYYHSHPDHPAAPSDFDREHAWPGTSYLIVSVRSGEVAESRSWRLADDRTHFEEEMIGVSAPSDQLEETRLASAQPRS